MLARLLGRVVRGLEQARNFLDRQHFGQRAAAPRPFEHGGGIVLALAFGIEKAMQLADRRKFSRRRARRHAALDERREISAYVVGGSTCNAASFRREEPGIVVEIAAIGLDRVL